MLLNSRVAAPKGGHPYSFFCSVPHTTPSYRHLPIRGALSVSRSDNSPYFYTSPMQNNMGLTSILSKKNVHSPSVLFFFSIFAKKKRRQK